MITLVYNHPDQIGLVAKSLRCAGGGGGGMYFSYTGKWNITVPNQQTVPYCESPQPYYCWSAGLGGEAAILDPEVLSHCRTDIICDMISFLWCLGGDEPINFVDFAENTQAWECICESWLQDPCERCG
jgi:hypothetical protein